MLYSGGLDSVAISYLLKPDVNLFVDYGTSACKRERVHVTKTCPPPNLLVVGDVLNLSPYLLLNAILPARNLFLVAIAAQYGNHIILGATAGDSTRDKDALFARLAGELFTHMYLDQGDKVPALAAPEGVKVSVPYKHLEKDSILRAYLAAGGSPAALLDSWSCYQHGSKECGTCRACFRKYAALSKVDLHYPELFETHPMENFIEHFDYCEAKGRLFEIEHLIGASK